MLLTQVIGEVLDSILVFASLVVFKSEIAMLLGLDCLLDILCVSISHRKSTGRWRNRVLHRHLIVVSELREIRVLIIVHVFHFLLQQWLDLGLRSEVIFRLGRYYWLTLLGLVNYHLILHRNIHASPCSHILIILHWLIVITHRLWNAVPGL